MARINIEGSLFTRGEWLNLVIRTGSPDTALGALARAWLVAQRYWFPDRKPIPKDVWERECLNQAVVDCGLAEVRDDGIYVRGSSEQFAWLFEASEKGKKGGRASAEKRKKAANSAKRTKKSSTTGEAQVDHSQPQVNLGEASLLLSPYSSSEEILRKGENSGLKPGDPPSADSPIGQQAVAEYYSAWREKYHKRAPLRDQDRKELKRLAESLGIDEARALIRKYLSIDDHWFKTKSHDVATLMTNLPKVQAYEIRPVVRFAVPD